MSAVRAGSLRQQEVHILKELASLTKKISMAMSNKNLDEVALLLDEQAHGFEVWATVVEEQPAPFLAQPSFDAGAG